MKKKFLKVLIVVTFILGFAGIMQADDLPSYITRPNCSVPPIKDLLLAPYLVDRWLDNGCINPEELIKVIAPIVKDIPAKKVEDNIKGYELLSRIGPTNEQYHEKRNYYKNRKKLISEAKKQKITEKKNLREEANQQKRLVSDLEILSWSWSNSSDSYVEATGLVKNVSGVTMNYVKVIVNWFTKSGTFITYDDAYIEYKPLMPNQESPFRVIVPYNPLMAKASIKFSMGGEQLRTFQTE